jgi:pyruvate dehydrogenase E2 component (dihydrolipoamide acetyltransferase)
VKQAVSQMRKVIARRLTESKQTVPHFYLTIDVDAQPLLDARASINAQLEDAKAEGGGLKISVNDLLVKACAIALRRVPECERVVRSADEILLHQSGRSSPSPWRCPMACSRRWCATRIKQERRSRSLKEVKRARLAARRSKKLKPEEMSGRHVLGLEPGHVRHRGSSAAVINPPEGAILAVGAVREESRW